MVGIDDLRRWMRDDYLALWQVVLATSAGHGNSRSPSADAVMSLIEPLLRDGTLRIGRRDTGPLPFNTIGGSIEERLQLIRDSVPLASDPDTDIWFDLSLDDELGNEGISREGPETGTAVQ